MSKLTKKEFCKLAGCSEQHVNEYVKRKKLVLFRGKLDTTNELNALFLAGKLGSEPKQKIVGKKNLVALEQEKKELDIQKTRKEISLLNIKETKLMGQYLPIDACKSVVHVLSSSLLYAHKNAADDLLNEIAHVHSIPDEAKVKYRGRIVTLLNLAQSRATAEAVKQIKAVSNDLAEIRTQGEKK